MELILWITVFFLFAFILVLLFMIWEHKRYPLPLPSYKISHPIGDIHVPRRDQ